MVLIRAIPRMNPGPRSRERSALFKSLARFDKGGLFGQTTQSGELRMATINQPARKQGPIKKKS
jgi:hypothetical protein